MQTNHSQKACSSSSCRYSSDFDAVAIRERRHYVAPVADVFAFAACEPMFAGSVYKTKIKSMNGTITSDEIMTQGTDYVFDESGFSDTDFTQSDTPITID